MDLRDCDRDLAELSRRLLRADAHGLYELAGKLAEDIDKLLELRVELQAAMDDCVR